MILYDRYIDMDKLHENDYDDKDDEDNEDGIEY